MTLKLRENRPLIPDEIQALKDKLQTAITALEHIAEFSKQFKDNGYLVVRQLSVECGETAKEALQKIRGDG